MKLMSRRRAFMRNGKKHFISLYNRNSYSQWYKDYSLIQMKWLWEHKMIKWSKPNYYLGEGDWNKYIEYTKLGGLIRAYYHCSYWEFTKYYILQYCWWKSHVYHPIMIHVFDKHYDWQDYKDYGYE